MSVERLQQLNILEFVQKDQVQSEQVHNHQSIFIYF